ncbi:MAG: RecX family transcriptional regulator [Bacteroidetes bacterium]|jgi:regulatory protein|nr:RecX family transcriptional regulator [Bacteroidota bacterium]MBT6686282.1 RecX family transcriptional regulator [Bacteroidota bacterium]MBT7145084.1 RecX family transcriptional regulator [Bacteroidota bacterium]MBT7490198.1 RecX family transcriptional regulator [Bacteroidota bacterium]
MQKKDKKQALIQAQNICSKTEKCKKDIRIKLKSWGICEEETDEIIEDLIHEDFINEKRFVSSFTNEKLRILKWGKIKIMFALKQKGISEENISHAMNKIPKDEYLTIIFKELEKKAKSISAKNEAERKNKLIRFGMSRGYEQDICFNFVIPDQK